MITMKNFVKLCKMSQADLKNHIASVLPKYYPTKNITSADGFLFAQGTVPVLLVAHLDTVHKELPKSVYYDPALGAISSPEGIGGDDRAGVYILLEVIKKFNCSVLLCEDEEIGTVGATKFVATDLAKGLTFNYIIEFDRKGSNDAVFYDCDNKDFETFITKEYFKTAEGIYSDISVIAPYLGCAAVNLSCGYYNPHTTNEYVVFKETQRIIKEACKILERTTDKDTFEYIEKPTSKWSGYVFDDYDDDRQTYYGIEYTDKNGKPQYFDVCATSFEEAVGIFAIETGLPYGSITDIFEE